MNYTVITYSIYLPITIFLTMWVARTLFKNGRVFLVEIFHQDNTLADSVNKLLLVGFYLVNIGYAVYTLKIWDSIDDIQAMIEVLSEKIGWIILVLGGMHFFNLFILFSLRRKAHAEKVVA
jgi:p-aminobenzoyl-glutamate transporter AbgT